MRSETFIVALWILGLLHLHGVVLSIRYCRYVCVHSIQRAMKLIECIDLAQHHRKPLGLQHSSCCLEPEPILPADVLRHLGTLQKEIEHVKHAVNLNIMVPIKLSTNQRLKIARLAGGLE